MENDKEIKGWSWLGFLFMPYYYAGYGDLKKGLAVAVFLGFFGELFNALMLFDNILFLVSLVIFFLVSFGIVIYGGMYAKEDLPVKKQKFNWLNVFYAFVAYVVGVLVVVIGFLLATPGTPKCNDTQTKDVVKQIALTEYEKQGMDGLSFKLSNIRVSSYDKEVGKYHCAADLETFYNVRTELATVPIIYTSQMIEDSEKFYVQVFGL